jgi:hypothetical protein
MQFSRGGSVPTSNITYAVKEGSVLTPPRGVNGIYAFALPDS